MLLIGMCVAQLCRLAPGADQSAELIQIPSSARPGTSIERAEHLFLISQKGELASALAVEAAELLDDEDPFVSGIAEWAISTKVNLDNNAETAVWPSADPPNWFEKWRSLDSRFLLQADYVRQGSVWGLHHDPQSLVASIKKILCAPRR